MYIYCPTLPIVSTFSIYLQFMLKRLTVIFIYLDSLVKVSAENRSVADQVRDNIVLQASLVNLSGNLLTDSLKLCFHFKGLLFRRRVPINCHCRAIVLSQYSFKPLDSSSQSLILSSKYLKDNLLSFITKASMIAKNRVLLLSSDSNSHSQLNSFIPFQVTSLEEPLLLYKMDLLLVILKGCNSLGCVNLREINYVDSLIFSF